MGKTVTMQKKNDGTQKLLLYIKLWVDALRAREKGDESTEDILLEKLMNRMGTYLK